MLNFLQADVRRAPSPGANLQEHLGHDAPQGLGRGGVVRLLHEVQDQVAGPRLRHAHPQQDRLQGHQILPRGSRQAHSLGRSSPLSRHSFID